MVAAQNDVNYTWNFGNGTTSKVFQAGQQVFDNTGRQPKSYTITFEGSTACGSFSQTASVKVRPRTKAEIGLDSTTVRCPPAVVRFSSRYTSAADTVLWNFGDQTTPVSTTASVIDHEFKAPASKIIYFVRLNIQGECGTDSDSIPVTVLPVSTTALFTISRSKICGGESVTFTDGSTPKPARVSWEINGEKLDGAVIIYDKFTKPSTTYRIKQTVYPECGGFKTYEQSIQTDSIPMGAFRLPMEACPDQPFSVTNLSSSTHRFHWNFGDSSPIDCTYFSPTHTFRKGGTTYPVTMTVVSFPVGCTASVSHTISIRNKVVPRFSLVDNKIVCSDTLVSLRDSSAYATQWKWYASGVLFSTAQNPQIRLNRGQYDIKLWTSNNGTCPDSVEVQDVVRVDTCVLQVADIFTPDGNNIGDHFTIYGSNLVRIQLLHVFSRSGGQVYEGVNIEPNNQTVGWDGTHQSQPLPPDNYVYEAIVKFTGGITRRRRCVITLLR